MSAYKLDIKAAAKAAFEAYSQQAGGKTHDGKDIPAWEDIGAPVQANWVAAATAISETFYKAVEFDLDEKSIITEALQYARANPGTKTNRVTVIAKMAKAVGIYK